MDVVIFHHFLESRDINATLVSCWFSSLNNLISNWFTWKMSILPKVAPSPFSADCPTRHWEFPPERPQGTHSPSEPTQGAGIKPRTLLPGHNAAKTERCRKITPYGNMQKFYYDEQHSVIHCAAGLSSQRRYPPPLQQMFMECENSPNGLIRSWFSPSGSLWSSAPDMQLLQSWFTGSVWGIS